ncbi:hypothetical protein MKW92_045685 [Papaver armeniacum]|nr:hypothetical protein MKW92_045685 [Papaver armeniacum]
MNKLKNNTMKVLISVSSLLLLVLLSSNNPFITGKNQNIIFKSSTSSPLHVHGDENLQVAHSNCEGTLYPKLCVSTLASLFPGASLKRKSISELISGIITHTVDIVKISASNCTGIKNRFGKEIDRRQKQALDECLGLSQDTILDLQAVVSILQSGSKSTESYNHVKTLLSSSLTNQHSCLDEFQQSDVKIRRIIQERLYKISNLVSISLAMLEKIPKDKEKKSVKNFPSWVKKHRSLLQSDDAYDLVVAPDGSGDFTSLNEAVEAAPVYSTTRFIIYIKEGVYLENVQVPRNKTLLMFIGDGIGKTVIKSNRSFKGGWSLSASATVDILGEGFIAKQMTFENSAGPLKEQAVALRSAANFTAFYRCSFVGYQDTLYVQKGKQFFRECDIYGTIDFVFGDAAVVFQHCNLYAKRPRLGQQNAFTAQGRRDPNLATGISILNCNVTAAADLEPVKSMFQTFLGRPWKLYSRTVYLNSFIDDVVHPLGWLEWNGTFALSTLYYGEYMNYGIGANTTKRVKWPGYRVINDSSEARKFTVASLIDGSNWLPFTNIPFFPGLSENEN